MKFQNILSQDSLLKIYKTFCGLLSSLHTCCLQSNITNVTFCQKIECVLYQIPQTVAVKGTSLLEQLHQPLRIERF